MGDSSGEISTEGAGVGLGSGEGTGEGVGLGVAAEGENLVSSMVTRLTSRPPGPRVMVESLIQPTPGANQRSTCTVSGQGSS